MLSTLCIVTTHFCLFCLAGSKGEPLKRENHRKGSVVNVNPTNIRPQSDTPEIRKYKKKFNAEVLCAGLWGWSFYTAFVKLTLKYTTAVTCVYFMCFCIDDNRNKRWHHIMGHCDVNIQIYRCFTER